MPNLVDLLIEDERWNVHDLSNLAETAVQQAVQIAGISEGEFEVSVLACNNERIGDLNSEFRGKTSPTNVLSWPAFELAPKTPGAQPKTDIPRDLHGPTLLGDIAISFEKVMEEAQNSHIPAQNHIIHLLIHASLHLLGYDHENELDAQVMEKLEVSALENLGIASPY